jgi:hypothetical protein
VRVVVAAGVAGAVVDGAAGVVDGTAGVVDGTAGVVDGVAGGAVGLGGAVVVGPDVPTGCEAGRDGAADGVWAIAGAVLSSNSKEQEIEVFIANILY